MLSFSLKKTLGNLGKALVRYAYAIQQVAIHRQALLQYQQDASLRCPRLLDLDLKSLYQQGVRVLVLDFDGVLSGHDGPEPLSELRPWLAEACAVFNGHLFVLSNTPSQVRANFFKQHYPQIGFLKPTRAKPYPDGLLSVTTQTQIPPEAVLMIDDRMFTGILSALLAKTRALLITQPYIDWRSHPFKEMFFSSLRHIEVWMLKFFLLF